MTFDLDLWPTDLSINRDHLLIKDYLPTEIEASWAKRSWVISCTRWSRRLWPLTLTFDLLTWISIGIIYSSRTIYLPSLKLLGHIILELSVAQGVGDQLGLWPTDLNINTGRDHLLIMGYLVSTYQVWSLWVEGLLNYWMLMLFGGGGGCWRTDWPTLQHVQSNMPLP